MWNGIIFSIMLIGILFFLGAILTSLSFIFLAPIVLTPKKDLEEILKIMKPEDNDNIMDLGCGDGRVLVEASKQAKIKGKGIDISPLIIMWAKWNKYLHFLTARKIQFEVENLFDTKLDGFNKIYCYTSEQYLEILEKKFSKNLHNTIVYTYRHKLPNKKHTKSYKLSSDKFLYCYLYN